MISNSKHVLDRFFSGTTDEKLAMMNDLYTSNGRELLQDEAVMSSLTLLTGYQADLSAQMKAMKMDTICRSCGNKKGGGCCSSYMEANSDVILLLMNRLQGNSVCRQEGNPEECCFLGLSGCTLPIKPIFCLNYNCTHIIARSSKAEMKALEQLAGRLLTEQTRLEQLLLERL